MRMFLSVSGRSSELSIANHSSRPTVSQLKCVSDTIWNWFENHQPQKTKVSTVIYAPLIQNSNQMAFRSDRNHKFTEDIFSTPAIFKATSKLYFGSRDCSDDKNWLDFPAFSSRFIDFAVQFCFRWKFLFHEERHSSTSQVWQWRDLTPPITILCFAQ